MKRFLTLVLAVVATLGFQPAFAQSERPYTYISIAGGDDVQIGYLNVDSIKGAGPKKKVWVLWVFHKEKVIDGKVVAYMQRQNEHDCSEGQFRNLYFAAYDPKGGTLATRAFPAGEAASPVIPGTSGESIHAVVCGQASIDPAEPLLSLDEAIADARLRRIPGQ